MGKLPGINHLKAVKAFERAGFEIVRQSGHIVMSDGRHMIVIPRHNPVNVRHRPGRRAHHRAVPRAALAPPERQR
jgi:predicted RNA binding protein YcfA (HicA-like mRNA interferase family)